MRYKKYRDIEFELIDKDDSIEKHPGYRVWVNIRQRCNNKNHKDYSNYGGRGIYVDSTWNNPVNFLLWYEDSYIEGYSIHRIDNDGPYSPNNCEYADNKTQRANQRRKRGAGVNKIGKHKKKWKAYITIDGEYFSLGFFHTEKEAKEARLRAESWPSAKDV